MRLILQLLTHMWCVARGVLILVKLHGGVLILVKLQAEARN